MAVNVADAPELVTPGDLGDELASFTRAMRANNVTANTITAYGGAVRQFGRWLMERGYPTNVEELEPRRVMPRVLTFDELRAVLGTCVGGDFEDRRDNALIRILFDTGARRHEIAALRYSPTDPDDRDVDTRRATVRVLGKGGKDNVIAVSDKTLSALDDYLRARRKHPHADLPWLWLGKRGRLTDSGIAQTIRDRGLRVGIDHLHPHDFRHAATHHELAGGLSESDVMSKRGWDSPAMLRRYASTTANERAIAASRKLGLGDKL